MFSERWSVLECYEDAGRGWVRIGKWCVAYLGILRKVHTAQSRLPYAYSHINLDAMKLVVCRDNNDERLRASLGNTLAVVDGQLAARRSWGGQADSDNRVLLEQGYRDSFRRMGLCYAYGKDGTWCDASPCTSIEWCTLGSF